MKHPDMKLRAHHGMCLAYFEGKGYSSEFTENMRSVSDTLNAHPDQPIEIVTKADILCEKCPNCEDGICRTAALVNTYDHQVLSLCGLTEHTKISWHDFSNLVMENILEAGKREAICGGCQWSGLCRSKENQ